MDKATAQAIHELATLGRLSDDSTERVADVLGIEVPGPEPEGNVPEAEPEASTRSKSAAKGLAR